MDTIDLIKQAKARFNHLESKIYLQEKYKNKLTFPCQGGMWTATKEFIAFLGQCNGEVVIEDVFGNPVKVDASTLLTQSWEIYNTVMGEWLNEYNGLSGYR